MTFYKGVTIIKKSAIFTLVILALTGCSHSPSTYPAHKSASNVFKSASNEYIINNLPLNYKVSIEGYNSRFVNNLLEVQVDLKNHKQKQYELEYRIRWFDDSGFEVESTPWLPLTINAMEFRSIKQIAHSPKVENFKFYIRAKQ